MELVIEGKLDPQAARVIFDAERWQAGKENPKRYSEKLDLNGGLKISHEEWLKRLE